MDKFHKGQRVQKRFYDNFLIACDSHVGAPKATAEAATADGAKAAATADGATGVGQELVAEETKKSEVTQNDVTTFRQACETACQEELEGRVVLLVAEGTRAEIHASVTSTRCYKNLAEVAAVIGFYDVKKKREAA